MIVRDPLGVKTHAILSGAGRNKTSPAGVSDPALPIHFMSRYALHVLPVSLKPYGFRDAERICPFFNRCFPFTDFVFLILLQSCVQGENRTVTVTKDYCPNKVSKKVPVSCATLADLGYHCRIILVRNSVTDHETIYLACT